MNAIEVTAVFHMNDLFLSILTLQGPFEWGWRMHPMWGWGWGMMAMMLLFWGVVILVGVAGIRWFIGQSKPPRADSAMEIIRERFARGEIDKDEFETKKRELS
jgi:putative membrane protein